MREHETFAILNVEGCAAVAEKDSVAVSSDVKEYVSHNTLGYYLVINTWLLIIRTFAHYAYCRVLERITQDGLLPTIRWAQDAADMVVHGTGMMSPLAASLLSEIRLTGRPAGLLLEDDKNIGRDPMATLLFLLRYPKRFSPVDADKIRSEAIADVIKGEKRLKGLQRSYVGRYSHVRVNGDNAAEVDKRARQERTGLSHFALQMIRQEILDAYDWDAICDEIESLTCDDIIFSSGAGFDSKASLGSKLKAIHAKHSEYFMCPFGARVVPYPPTEEEGEVRVARIAAVPKSYKAARIIAMEDTYRLAYAKRVEMIFRQHDKRTGFLNLEDQGVNQVMAQQGSRDGSLVTLDASHGSDFISVTAFVDTFPSRYVRLVMPLLATHLEIDGKLYLKQMLSTAGHTLTFRHESIFYKAVALAGGRLCADCGVLSHEEVDAGTTAYGDDTICPSIVADTVIDFFDAVGLVINRDKSFFADEPYRESCGEEYWNGVVMTSLYFPRFPVLGSISGERCTFSQDSYRDEYRGKIDNAVTMVIDLQKKIYRVSYEAARFLYSIVKLAYPTMTSSRVGEVCPDLWEYDDLGETRPPQTFEFVDVEGKWRKERQLRKADKVVPERVLRAAQLDTYHMSPYVAYDGKEKYSDLELRLYDLYRYQEFLKSGPRYNSDLDRLLGITQRPMPISQMFGKTRLAWRKELI
jgi:hypothetical protein